MECGNKILRTKEVYLFHSFIYLFNSIENIVYSTSCNGTIIKRVSMGGGGGGWGVAFDG